MAYAACIWLPGAQGTTSTFTPGQLRRAAAAPNGSGGSCCRWCWVISRCGTMLMAPRQQLWLHKLSMSYGLRYCYKPINYDFGHSMG